ncbi:MAG TPA: MFS transporter, partial [Mesotoga sp.]|nr:MFS transporter [Mesotoga sp.]
MIEKMERNVRVYNRFRFSQNMLIIGPVLVPYMIFKGLSYSEIMLLQSISAISVVLFEVPTGSLADRISRKFSLVISSL